MNGRRGVHRHTGSIVTRQAAPYIPCRRLGNQELVTFAEGADRIEFHEAAPSAKLSAAGIAIFLEALRGLPWIESASNPGELRRDLRRQIQDRRARIRFRDGRDFLVGTVTHGSGETEERVLLLILASNRALSCDCQLEP